MIIYGTNSYVLKSFSAADLGIYTGGYEQYRFQKILKYFHLYWIPLFPTGSEYVFSKPGSSEKYIAPDGFRQLMQGHGVAWWKHLGGFALPLLAMFGFGAYSASNSMDEARYQKQAMAEKQEVQKMASDTAEQKACARKVNGVYQLVLKNYEEHTEKFSKIDTSLSKVMMQMLNARFSITDSTTNFTDSNTFIYHHSFSNYIYDDKNVVNVEDIDEVWNSNRVDKNICEWYKTGMQKDKVESFYPSNFMAANNVIKKKKYLAVMRINGIATPKVFGEAIAKRDVNSYDKKVNAASPAYETGYVSANVYMYDLETKKPMFDFKVFAHNSETISTYGQRGENISSQLERNLYSDLGNNLNNEVRYALRILNRRIDKERLQY
jgi:hypothetical protein